MPSDLRKQVRQIRSSIIATGFSPEPGKMTINGSGFCVSADGKIMTAAHVYNTTPPEFQPKLMGMAMTKQVDGGLEHYAWLPLTLIKKDDRNDVAVFQLADYDKTLLKALELGDSDTLEVGQDTYFAGFPYAAQLMNEGWGITLVIGKGIVSNIKQDGQMPAHPRNLIMIDSISNPGNSGGPIFDLETNKVIGVMSIAFRMKSKVAQFKDLDIREPMHVAGAKPINLAKSLL